MKTQKPDKWEKEFRKRFIRDDGLMNKYSWIGGNQVYMAEAIKPFISNLLSRQRQELLVEVEEMIEEMYKDEARFSDVVRQAKNVGFNQALSNLQAKIKEMK